jgi:predicted enzyme related to lactoylglutathione lyase
MCSGKRENYTSSVWELGRVPGRLRATIPQFTVTDVVRTAEYYRDVLGFTIAGYWQEPPVFAIVHRDDVEVFFNQAAPGTEPRTGRAPGAYDAYVRVDDIDSFAAEVAQRGANIIEGPTTREYGMRELVVSDCNGLILAFGEPTVAG